MRSKNETHNYGHSCRRPLRLRRWGRRIIVYINNIAERIVQFFDIWSGNLAIASITGLIVFGCIQAGRWLSHPGE